MERFVPETASYEAEVKSSDISVGYDSLGNPIYPNSFLILETSHGGEILPIQEAVEKYSSARTVELSTLTLENLADHFTSEASDIVIDLETLGREGFPPLFEGMEVLSSSLDSDRIRIQGRNFSKPIAVEIERDSGMMRLNGEPVLSGYWQVRNSLLQWVEIKLRDVGPTEFIDLPDRLTSEQVLSRLRQDFPWFSAEDFANNIFIELSGSVADQMQDDFLFPARLKQLYPLLTPKQREEVCSSLTDQERAYFVARNYANLVTLAATARAVGESSDLTQLDIQSRLQNIRAEDRMREAASFFIEIDTRTQRLLSFFHEMETEVFAGTEYEGKRKVYLDSLASKTTLKQEVLGLHIDGMIVLSSSLLEDVADIFSQIPPQQRAEAFYEMTAEIIAHENGHLSSEDTVPRSGRYPRSWSWSQEEIWNDWATVVGPRKKQGIDPFFPSAYHRSTRDSHEVSGAFRIQEMVEACEDRLTDLTGLFLRLESRFGSEEVFISPDMVEKIAFATYYTRRSSGTIETALGTLPTFPLLYDSLFGMGVYDRQLEGLSDQDYQEGNPTGLVVEAAEKKIQAEYTRQLILMIQEAIEPSLQTAQ